MSQRASFIDSDQLQASSFSMHDRPRPIEPGLNNGSVQVPSPSVYESFGDLPSMNIDRSSKSNENNMQLPAQQHSLYNWYYSHEKPWDPIQGKNTPVPRSEDVRTGTRSIGLIRHGVSVFSGYRGSVVPSECETSHAGGMLPSDSGYESRTRHSAGTTSIYGDVDRSGETQSITSNLAGFQFNRPGPSRDIWSQHGTVPAPAAQISMNVDSNKLVCPSCHETVKTKSELNKHRQKHTKPHRCDVPDCPREQGFSTTNDLDRHKRSCHPHLKTNGARYICNDYNCKTKDKIWPRSDNFRSHLKKVHKLNITDEDLGSYKFKEPDPVLAGLATAVPDGMIPMDMDHDVSVLSPNSWYLHTVQEGRPEDSCQSEYLDHSMGFQDHAGLGEQHFEMMSSVGCGEQIPQDLVHMSPVELDADNVAPCRQESNIQYHVEHAPVEQTQTADDVPYVQSSYPMEASPPARNCSQETQAFEAQEETELLNFEDTSPSPGDQAQSMDTSSVMNLEQSEDGSSEGNAIFLGDDAPADAELADIDASGSDDEPQSPARKDGGIQYEQPESTSASPDHDDLIADEDKASDLLKTLEDKGTLARILEQLGYQKADKTAETTPKKAPSVQSAVSERGRIVCTQPNCDKNFLRRCELKKHMKRHEKPYGCTFPQCRKKFGSKNDWKRHENSQHFQLVVWKCIERLKPDLDELCGRACHRHDSFKMHLTKDHGMNDPALIELKMEECRNGRTCEARFWCGFCQKSIEIKEKGLKGWTERFNHIDNHFSGRTAPKMQISQWKCVDDFLETEFPASSESEDGSARESPEPSSASPAEPETAPELASRSSKRRRDDEDEEVVARPKKRQRQPETMWFCCQCNNPYFTKLADSCMTDICREHVRCENCKVEVNRPTEQL